MSDPLLQQRELVQHLLASTDAADTALIETHVSWLLLIGGFAYKIKKALDLGFLDYSNLHRRRFFCEEEVRLNSRTAPTIYLAAVAITGSPQQPCLEGDGEALEYAVKMRRFPDGCLLSELAHDDRLTPALIDTLAAHVAKFHAAAARADQASPWGSMDETGHPVAENFAQILPHLIDAAQREQVEQIAEWARATQRQQRTLIEQRRETGFVRECHGDLHLGNIVLLDGKPRLFDGIEFSERLRWIDVLNDSAFLMMDLEAHGLRDLAWRFLDAYLQHTGDYAALPLLYWYLSYRAMVRAKIAALRAGQIADPEGRRCAQTECSRYLQQAAGYAQAPKPRLIITRGLSGSGKTYHGQRLLESLALVRLRSDVERKRLFGLRADERSGSTLEGGIYSTKASEQVYAQLLAQSRYLLESGLSVLVDATFLKRAQRQVFFGLSKALQVPFLILDFQASEDTLRQRIIRRNAEGKDASEADITVLEQQRVQEEKLGEDERDSALKIDTESAQAGAQLAVAVERYFATLDLTNARKA